MGITSRTHSTRPRSGLYSDIRRPDAPVIYTGAFPILTSGPGRRSIYNIAHTSRSFLPAEKQYSQIEKGSLGIIFAVTPRQMVYTTDRSQTPVVDFRFKKGLLVYTANRYLRRSTILLNNNFKIDYLGRKTNTDWIVYRYLTDK